jgi:Tol biopolymer transport system component
MVMVRSQSRTAESPTRSSNWFAWSPHGKRIAFDGNWDPDPDSVHAGAIYMLMVASKAVKKVVDAGGPHRNPVGSPDGSRIAYDSANGQE